MDFDIGYLGAFIGGLISFLSPCVLPLVPPYLAFLTGVTLSEITEEERASNVARRVITASIAFVLGFTTIFVGLGASATFFGSFLTTYLNELAIVAGVIIIILGLHFIGVFRIALLMREVRYQPRAKPIGLFGSYIIGLAFAFGWTPCAGPVLAAILFIAAGKGSVIDGASLLAAYSLGIGIPFILAAVFASPFLKFMQKFRKHMHKIEIAMGVLLVITGILFITGSMRIFSMWILEYFPAISTFG